MTKFEDIASLAYDRVRELILDPLGWDWDKPGAPFKAPGTDEPWARPRILKVREELVTVGDMPGCREYEQQSQMWLELFFPYGTDLRKMEETAEWAADQWITEPSYFDGYRFHRGITWPRGAVGGWEKYDVQLDFHVDVYL